MLGGRSIAEHLNASVISIIAYSMDRAVQAAYHMERLASTEGICSTVSAQAPRTRSMTAPAVA